MQIFLFLLILAFQAVVAMAAPKAIPLDEAIWLQGEPVKRFALGKFYVVEFWATWCGPCVDSMPHLSELQKAYGPKGVTIIGVAGREQAATLEERQQLVEKFLREHKPRPTYAIAFDPDGQIYKAYSGIHEIKGIPTAFVVNELGEIAFTGHPMALEGVLPKILNGTFDQGVYEKEMELEQEREIKLYEELVVSSERGDYPRAHQIVDELSSHSAFNASNLKFIRVKILISEGRTQEACRLFETIVKGGDDIALMSVVPDLYKDGKSYKQLPKRLRRKVVQDYLRKNERKMKADKEETPKVHAAIKAVLFGVILAEVEYYETGNAKKALEILTTSADAMKAMVQDDSIPQHLIPIFLESFAVTAKKVSAASGVAVDLGRMSVEAKKPDNVICEGGVCRIVDKSEEANRPGCAEELGG